MRNLRALFGVGVLAVTLVGTVVTPASGFVGPGRPAPELTEGAWINSAPLTLAALRGRVVLVEFWTYG
jgi:hypothetical protein